MSSPPSALPPRASMQAGARAVSPVLLGVAPFGLVVGVAATEAGLRLAEAVGFSALLFAGASQLAAIELIGSGAPAWVAIMTAVVINLRMAMYSASLGSYLTHEPLGRRAVAAYFLVDQAYGLAVARFQNDGERPSVDRWWFFLGSGALLWVVWQTTTVLGVVVGGAVPEAIPLGFAVPLTFLSLLIPSIRDRPTLVAAIVGGSVAVAADPLPANLGMPVGALSGVIAGFLASRRGRTTWS